MDQFIYDAISNYNERSYNVLDDPPFTYLMPDGAVDFEEISDKEGKFPWLSYTLSVNDLKIAKYHRRNNFTRVALKKVPVFLQSKVLLIVQGKLALMELVHNAYMQYLDLIKKPSSAIDQFASTIFAQQMPTRTTASILSIVEIFGTFLYPLALSLQVPIYVYIIVYERELGLLHLQLSMGMSKMKYLLTNYLFNYVIYTVVVIFFWLSGIGIQLRFFTQTGHFSSLHPHIPLLFID